MKHKKTLPSLWWARWCSFLAVSINPKFSFCHNNPTFNFISGQSHGTNENPNTYKLIREINHYYWPEELCGLHEAPSVVLQASSVRPKKNIFFTHILHDLEKRKMGGIIFGGIFHLVVFAVENWFLSSQQTEFSLALKFLNSSIRSSNK